MAAIPLARIIENSLIVFCSPRDPERIFSHEFYASIFSLALSVKRSTKKLQMLGAHDMSGIVAHNLSGLRCRREVTDEADRMAAGDPEDAI